MSRPESPDQGKARAVSQYMVPDMPAAAEVLPYLKRMDNTRWYANFGPLVGEFEGYLQQLFSTKDEHPEWGNIQLTTVVSCQLALEIGLHLLGIGPRKRVLVPAVTFAACPLAVQHVGAEPILSDVDAATWMLTPATARAAADRVRIDAVMPVAVYGVPVPVAEWDEFCTDTGIPVIIDAASAVEVQTPPRHGLVACSLHATKPFGIGEGGILASRDRAMIEMARQCANFGMIDRISQTWGTNAKMSEYHAAVGLAQVARWNGIKQVRRNLLNTYARHLESLRDRAFLQRSVEKAVVSSLMISMTNQVTDSGLSEMRREGIAVHRPYLPPLYDHPYFANLATVDTHGAMIPTEKEPADRRCLMKNSEMLRASLVGVPFHHLMKEDDVALVVDNLGRCFCPA